MSDDDVLHRFITKFMLNTCRCTTNEQTISQRILDGVFVNVVANSLFGDTEAFSSGSFAELYIRPILYCYGDIDIMHNFKSALAIFRTENCLPWNYGIATKTLLLCMKSSTVTSLDMFTYNSRTLLAQTKTVDTSFGALEIMACMHHYCVTVQIFRNNYSTQIMCSDFVTK